jgi:hypothetical protein
VAVLGEIFQFREVIVEDHNGLKPEESLHAGQDDPGLLDKVTHFSVYFVLIAWLFFHALTVQANIFTINRCTVETVVEQVSL